MALLIIVDHIQLKHAGKAYIDQQMIVNSIINYILYNAMELEGAKRSFKFLSESGLKVAPYSYGTVKYRSELEISE